MGELNVGSCGLDSCASGQGSLVGSCGHGNEPSSSMEGREFLDKSNESYLLS